MLLFEVVDEGLRVESVECLRDLCAQIVTDPQGAPYLEQAVEAFDLAQVTMAELHLALRTLRQLSILLFSLDLASEALLAEDVTTGKPFWVFGKDIPTDGTLKFFVHQLVLLGCQIYLD